jgi:hypothetical protein
MLHCAYQGSAAGTVQPSAAQCMHAPINMVVLCMHCPTDTVTLCKHVCPDQHMRCSLEALAALQAHRQNMSKVMLTCFSSNKAALRMYAKRQYIIDDSSPDSETDDPEHCGCADVPSHHSALQHGTTAHQRQLPCIHLHHVQCNRTMLHGILVQQDGRTRHSSAARRGKFRKLCPWHLWLQVFHHEQGNVTSCLTRLC